MRLATPVRLALTIALMLLIGLPGAGGLAVPTVRAQGVEPAGVWTGVLADPSATESLHQTPPPGLVPVERLIVRFRPRAPRAAQQDAHQAARAIRADALALEGTVRVVVGSGETANAIAAYSARPDVLYAEPDYRVRALYTPNDPQFGSQWGMQKIGAPAAWDVTRGAAGIRVAVLDCGVFSQGTGRAAGDGQAGHPDLRGRVVLEQDFTGSPTGVDDYCDHGTHVAGIVAATADNGTGVAGLAHGVSLMNGKVLDDNGDGYTSDILNGIVWAVDNGAKVINLSLGRDGACSASERDTMAYAWQRGAVVVAAAGNSGLGASGAPANCANVVSVASTTSSDQRSSFSNYGTDVDVAAPGSSIVSTLRDGGYGAMSGTSMASPHVAGLAGLLYSVNPSMSPAAVVDRIAATADQIGGTGSLWAWGRINAARALSGLAPQPGPAPQPTPQPTPAPPPPSPVACPSPRPRVVVTTSPTSANGLAVSVQAGAGVIRELNFSELRNAAVSTSAQQGVTSPFAYQPSAYTNVVSFTVTPREPGQPIHVALTATDDCGPWPTFVGAGAGALQRGTINGTVRSATTSQPIAGATVSVRGIGRSTRTAADGSFAISDVPIGTQTVEVSATGYQNQTTQASVRPNEATTVAVALAPAVDTTEIVVSLTWGSTPADLDAHLSGPSIGSSERFHVYWGNRSPVAYASLTADDRDGGGPETIVIRPNPSTGTWVAGEYRFWAHNFSGAPGWLDSSARVTVTRGGRQLAVYKVEDAEGTTSVPIWMSVSLTVDAAGNVTLTPVQEFESGGSGTVLRFEEGPGRTVEWPARGK